MLKLILLLQSILIHNTDTTILGEWVQSKIIINGQLAFDKYNRENTYNEFQRKEKQRAFIFQKYFKDSSYYKPSNFEKTFKKYSENKLILFQDGTCCLKIMGENFNLTYSFSKNKKVLILLNRKLDNYVKFEFELEKVGAYFQLRSLNIPNVELFFILKK